MIMLLQPVVLLSIVLKPTTDNFNIVVTAAIPTRVPQNMLFAIAMPVKDYGVSITDPRAVILHMTHCTPIVPVILQQYNKDIIGGAALCLDQLHTHSLSPVEAFR